MKLAAGLLEDAGERRVAVARADAALHDGRESRTTRFDRVVYLAALLYPRRPVQLAPP